MPSSSRYLLIAAAIHVVLAITIFLAGHFRVLPNIFDQNGISLTFAIDGTTYQQVATDLAGELQRNGFSAWFNAKAPLHSRLYSISFAILGAVNWIPRWFKPDGPSSSQEIADRFADFLIAGLHGSRSA